MSPIFQTWSEHDCPAHGLKCQFLCFQYVFFQYVTGIAYKIDNDLFG
ncbi:Uncharacterized protein dnm_036750 [Desulfonema magnum]|uniref:Uncharacterized protein n=1 Tax=Desulfonema magnum TaxID=45655 RepID=A0A975GN61_9BACT|nr:Uncharacterized protein dnm_036750 [Desulfonema magnum]